MEHEQSYPDPHLHCTPCGSLVNYVDDRTYTFTHKDPNMLSQVLSDKYRVVEEYMVNNKLVINADKTHLVVMGSRKMDTDRQSVRLTAGLHTIVPSVSEKLLGCNIHQNLKWQTHIQNAENSLTRQLTSRLNALQKVSVNACFKTRLSAANGVFMSSLAYLLPLWGGCEGYLIKTLQVLQNRAARQVTKLSWYTPVRKLLSQCNWLSIRQLIFYHSSLTVYRTTKTGVPVYLRQNLTSEHRSEPNRFPARSTRGIAPDIYGVGESGHEEVDSGDESGDSDDEWRQSTGGRGGIGPLVQNSFLVRAAESFNQIPANIRLCRTLPLFKKKLKQWIKLNMPYD